MTELLETAPHEFDASLVFADNGLDPFYGFEAVVRRSGGSPRIPPTGSSIRGGPTRKSDLDKL